MVMHGKGVLKGEKTAFEYADANDPIKITS